MNPPVSRWMSAMPAEVRHPVRRRVDVAEHDRRGAPEPDVVGGPDDLLPGVGGQLPLREEPPDVVVEDLRGRSRDRPEAVVLAGGQELPERDPHLRRAVEDLHRAEGVDVDPRDARLHGVQEVQVEGPREVGVDTALHAHLARALGPGLLRAVGDLLERERVRLGVHLSLGERAEAAPDVADVREVDVPVDHVGDDVADGLPAQAVRDRSEGIEVGALRLEERERLGVGDRAVALGLPEGLADLGAEACRGHGPGRPGRRHGVLGGDLAVDRGGVRPQTGLGPLREREIDRPRLPRDVRVLPRDRLREPRPRARARRRRAAPRSGAASCRRPNGGGRARTAGRS